MPLFKIDKKNFINHKTIAIEGENFLHLIKPLRKKINDNIFVTDSFFIYRCKIIKITKNHLEADILSKQQVTKNALIKISLYVSIIKYSHFELLLNTATQLGVNEIIPIQTDFSQKNTSLNRYNRGNKIIQEAAKQSFNPNPPVLKNIIPFKNAIQSKGFNIMLHPSAENNIKNILKPEISSIVNIYIGPEGGFSENEIKLANRNKINIVSLPYYILRTETAVMSVVSNILFFYS